jgi:hypothetical protein
VRRIIVAVVIVIFLFQRAYFKQPIPFQILHRSEGATLGRIPQCLTKMLVRGWAERRGIHLKAELQVVEWDPLLRLLKAISVSTTRTFRLFGKFLDIQRRPGDCSCQTGRQQEFAVELFGQRNVETLRKTSSAASSTLAVGW